MEAFEVGMVGKTMCFFPFGEKSLLSWWVKPVKPNPCQRFTRGIAVLPLDGFPWGGSLICKKKQKHRGNVDDRRRHHLVGGLVAIFGIFPLILGIIIPID